EARNDDLQRMERLRRQERLPSQLAPRHELPRLTPEHPRPRLARREEVRDLDPEGSGEPLERRDRGVRAATLELAQKALADTCPRRDLLQRLAPQLPDRPQPFAELDVDRRRSDFSHLQCEFSRVKRLYACIPRRSTRRDAQPNQLRGTPDRARPTRRLPAGRFRVVDRE